MSSNADAVHQITNLVYGYAEALDRGDLEAVAAFFEFCTIRVDGLPNTAHGSAEVREFFKPVLFYKGDAAADQCVDGRWRFCERLEYLDLVGDLSRHLTMAIPVR